MNSPVTTLSTWVLSLVETGSDGGIGASVGASWVVAAEAEAMASATVSAPLKEATNRYVGNSKSLLTHRMINRNGLGINLRKGCQSEKRMNKHAKKKKKEKEKKRYIIIYDNDKEHGCMHK